MSNLNEVHIRYLAAYLRAIAKSIRKDSLEDVYFSKGYYEGNLYCIFQYDDLEEKEFDNLISLGRGVINSTNFEKYLEIEECKNLIRAALLEN